MGGGPKHSVVFQAGGHKIKLVGVKEQKKNKREKIDELVCAKKTSRLHHSARV